MIIITMLMILHVIGVGAFTINNCKILNRYVSKGWAVSIRSSATSIRYYNIILIYF
jgi:hypothetical protein